MSQRDNSTLRWKNCALNRNKMEEMRKIRYKNFRFTILVGVVISFFILSLVILLVYDITHPSKNFKTKTKRFVNPSESEILKKVEALKEIKNIQIIPEWESNNRKIDRYPNHKYNEMESTDEIYTKMKDLYSGTEWDGGTPKGSLKSLRNVVLKKNPEFKVNHFVDDDFKGFGKMRLRGVFLHPEKKDNVQDQDKEFSDNYYYLKEINELMQSESNGNGDEEKKSLKKAFKGHGSGFQPPPTDNHPQQYNYWNKEKKPITILLEIYPMRNYKHYSGRYSPPRRLPNGMEYHPKSPWEHFGPKTDRGEKLIMKLNLFPKKNKYYPEYLRNNKRAEKRFWGKKLRYSPKMFQHKISLITRK